MISNSTDSLPVIEPSLEIAALEPPPVPFKDRSTGLVVFGVMTILLGGLAGLFVPLMLFGQAMAAKTTKVPPDFSMILPAVAIYGIMVAGAGHHVCVHGVRPADVRAA